MNSIALTIALVATIGLVGSIVLVVASKKLAVEEDERLGEILAASYKKVIREDDLPNGRMYYNIANRIIKPPLRTNYDMVMETSEDIQKAIDVSDGLGIGTIAPDFPEARVDGLIDKLSDPENDFVRIIYWLGEPIVNNTEAFADDFVRAGHSLQLVGCIEKHFGLIGILR